MKKIRIIICDHDLKSEAIGAASHGYNFAANAIEGGYEVEILGHQSCDISGVKAAFKRTKGSFKAPALGNKYLNYIGFLYLIILHNLSYFIHLRKAILSASDSRVIAINVGLESFWGLLLVALIGRKNQFVPYFQSDPSQSFHFARPLLRILRRRVLLASEVEFVSKKCETVFRRPCATVPWPVALNVEATELNPTKLVCGNGVLGVALGSPRLEKGFDLIVGALDGIQDLIADGRLRLAVQIDNRDQSLSELTTQLIRFSKQNSQIDVFATPAPREKYLSWLLKADFVMIPYKKHAYNLRSSGILFEAICQGKPIVINEELDLALEPLEAGAGVGFRDDDLSGFINAIRQMVDNIPVYREAAAGLQVRMRRRHSMASFLHSMRELQA